MTLRPADLADIGFIKATAGSADNAPYLTDPTARVLIWGNPVARGFATLAMRRARSA